MFEELKRRGWNIKDINHGIPIASTSFEEEMQFIENTLLNFSLKTEDHFIKRGGGEADQTRFLSLKFEEMKWLETTVEVRNQILFSQRFGTVFNNSITHKIDHIGFNEKDEKFALEIEWNNKDEFFDRDLANFQNLWNLKAIEFGIIITRGENMEDAIRKNVKKYFQENAINNIDDFKILRDSLKDDKGNSKFSFPTEPQKKAIQKNSGNFLDAITEIFCSQKYGNSTTNWKQIEKRMKSNLPGRTPLVILGIPGSVID